MNGQPTASAAAVALTVAIVAVIALWTPAASAATLTRVVQTRYGKLQGVVRTVDAAVSAAPGAPPSATVDTFLGVPYATPPVGSNRFGPTRTPSPWDGVRMADAPGPVCPQRLPDVSNETAALHRMPVGRLVYLKRLLPYLRNQSEDCLYLNIYAPSQGSRIVRKYPVLVFIHGESYEWNSGNPYDGRVLASNAELVVVTLNYRLGILGFLNANGSPNSRARVANYGLMDQIAVLHWVQQNIALFGGDPENVSLMGHGPGAACINFLMISPTVVPGLFRRAILLSGSALSSWALVEDPVSYALDLAKQVNCTTDGTGNNPEPIVDCLREVPLDLLMSAGVALPTYLSAFGPSVDGVVVKSNYQEDVITNLLPEFDGYSGSSVAFGARKFQKFEFGSGINKYDLLFGVVTSEALWRFSSNDIQAGFEGDRRDKILRTYVRNAYSYHLSEIFFTIVNEYTDWERTVLHPINTRDATIAALSDAQYVAPLVHTGDMLSQPKTPAADDLNKDRRTKSFFYVFDYQTRDGDYPQRIGTAHGEELPYMFGAPMVTDGMNHFSRNFTKAEALLSDAMILYLGNFARTGDPNDHDDKPDSGSKERNRFRSVTWDEYDPVHQKYLEISMKPRMKNHFRAHQLSVWLRLIPELHRAGMEDVMLRHNLFRNHDDAELYEGVVRPDPLSRRAPQRATVNRFTANGTVAEVVQSLTTTGRPQWPAAEATTCLPPARGSNAANASTSAEDALATLGAAGYAAYSTALHVTIALGVSLLVLNGLLLVIICYQKDRFKCLQHHQQHQHQQTVGGQEDSVRYKAATVPDDRLQQSAAVVVDKAGGYDGRHHHMQHHHHPPAQQMHLAADAVAVDMEQRHHHHHGAAGHHQHHHMHHHHVPAAAGGQHPPLPQTTATMTTTTQQQQLSAATAAVRMAAGHDMTFPKAAKPSSRLLHDHQVGGGSGGCPPNGSLVHGTLPKPPPPPRSSVGVQSQESQPLLVQQGVGIGQMPKTGTLKMPVAAMSEMRV
ncbi:neuroligin-4, Y-linked-like [Acyrthosiphon pisum]|uniref:Carboxylesterase type B domain-containing protein n=1 Tax=Acyrthosiphon pisum TaxID=7029 RepID=A0A8R2JRB8_ACYPI|nr:neuroligin-4, Y-linked-like [Acyrthosiphon pisum]XP_029344586.1 neuroligin-4, Y-linked-like [Acyrthosiphon pisum]XP_029344587.1 neuroligin-4, Y-linked-like [Acyrthosiphon pisum]XP_029344588.1 neuroligin-4, Y-linked-like [Acyrthosiphon pisum]